MRQLRFEGRLHCGIGRLGGTVAPTAVVGEKIGLEDLQPTEFREKICRSVGNVAERIIRIQFLINREGSVRACEVQVVHLTEAAFELGLRYHSTRGLSNRGGGTDQPKQRRGQSACNAAIQLQILTPDHELKVSTASAKPANSSFEPMLHNPNSESALRPH